MRLFTYSALILRVRSSGESNREAWILTAEEGILRATVFGGPKSKLRAHVEPYHRGTLWIYLDPVRDSRKITDFDVLSWKPGIRENYERSAAAAAIAETVLAGYGGGGSWEEAFKLADASFGALETADEPCCARIFIHFLWKWAEILGIQPNLDETGTNACEPQENEIPWDTVEGPIFLGPGARHWLAAVKDLDPAQMARYTLDGTSARQARAFVTNILEDVLGKRLRTWDF
ncbi:DNA repair protein RecO [Treponema primitia]|uniref:DNA repair protein RecO n=1 Tax=Treponema primitia TaxID=88058 RepID=UPI0002554F12|nr:recombination protein O N-terminal domain-containing protein [Treponema primitia]